MSADDWAPTLDDVATRRDAARAMGGPEKLQRHHAKGKLDARARVDHLLDDDSFTEIGVLVGGALPADAFVAGVGSIDGRPVAIGAEDFTVAGGSIGAAASSKRYRVAELAMQERMPLVMLLEGAGHRPPMPDDPPGRRTPGDLQRQASNSGYVPMVTGVFGPSAGHGALSAPLADFTVMTEAASIFTAGPPLVKASLGEDITKEALGGPDIALASGVIHNPATDDIDALDQIRRWLAFLPGSAWTRPPQAPAEPGRLTPELLDIVPRNPRQAYDMRDVIEVVVDENSWFEIQPRFGPSMITGLAHIGGQVVAIVANQPAHLAGTIDVDAADKAAHFVQVADSFHLPLLQLTDNPGALAGSASERAGILRHAARMFAAQHAATVPKIQLTLRKAYGFGSTAMGMNPFDNQTLNLAYPGVTFGAMPARGADDATGADADTAAALREAELASGYRSAGGLSIDDIIDPTQTRNAILAGLAMAAGRLTGPVEPKARVGIL